MLRPYWDLVIYLHVPPEETMRRALARDRDLFGGPEAVRERYARRYLVGQTYYREQVRPMDRADVALEMTDPACPIILRGPWIEDSGVS